MKSLRRLFIAVALPLLVGFITVGCSGLKQPPTKTLSSIAVAPASPPHLKVGATQQFTATGTYSDNSTADITSTVAWTSGTTATATISTDRSEEHTSELQSRQYLVCRLLLEKKKTQQPH